MKKTAGHAPGVREDPAGKYRTAKNRSAGVKNDFKMFIRIPGHINVL
jgi:hypothetical protein